MRMPSLFSSRVIPATGSALLLVFAVVATGCASKNPLIDEPVAETKKPAPSTSSAARTSAPAPAQNQTAEAKPATASSEDAAAGATGVQTTKQRRFLGIFSPYRPDIQQGNFVSKEMVAQLKEGMTPEQVRFVLGTPLLNDIFHANRWDYPFRLVQGNGKITESHVTVYFKDNRLARVEGGDLPTEADFLSLIAGSATPPKRAVPATHQTPQTEAEQSQ